jgi:hypothetical protein
MSEGYLISISNNQEIKTNQYTKSNKNKEKIQKS